MRLRLAPLLAFLLLPCLASTLVAQTGSPSQIETLFHRGAEAMHAGNIAAAEAAFRKATEIAPDFAPARLDLGLAELKQGSLTEAIADIRKSLELDPSSPGAHLFLGIAEYQSSHPQEAIVDLKQAIQENPKDEQAYTWLGIVELNTGHPELAVGPLDKAAALDPTDENVLDYRVQAHLAVARQSYAQLYKLNPGSWRLHQLSAVIDSDAEDHQHAIGEYLKAIKLAPNQPTLYEALGWEYRALNENDRAVAAFKHQLALTPGNPIAMYNVASAEVENGQPQDALPLLEHVVKIYGTPTLADYYLGRALAAQGQYAQAANEFTRATQLSGEVKPRAWYELSQVYRHLGQTAKAREAVLEFQKLKEETAKISTKNTQDFLKMNHANAAAAAGKQP